MNTIEELVTMGFPESTARRMLASYKSHIGEMIQNGVVEK